MTEPALLVETRGPILCATLNRPEKLNALNRDIIEGLRDAVARFATDPGLRVFLILANGRFFSAGADLTQAQPPTGGEGTAAVREWYRTTMGWGMRPLHDEMEAIEKPFVVAHHATCVGGGLELSLSCDFRLAAASARYLFPEAKLGSIPATGGVSRLTRLVGPHWAKWMIMANQPVEARAALNMGLVHAVYEDAEFHERVITFCEELARVPSEMQAMAKLTIDLVANAEPAQARLVERLGQSILHVGQESEALMASMREHLTKRS